MIQQVIESAVYLSTAGSTATVRAPRRHKLSCLQIIDDVAHCWELTEHGDRLAVSGQVDTSFGRQSFAIEILLCDVARVKLGDLYAVTAFLALPPTAGPQATFLAGGDDCGVSAWDLLRVPGLRCGDTPVRLRADCDGWRDGVIVTL